MKRQVQQSRRRSNENFQKRLKTYWKYVDNLRQAYAINAYIFLQRYHQIYIINTTQSGSNQLPTVEEFLRSRQPTEHIYNHDDKKFKKPLEMLWKKSSDLKTLYETKIYAFIWRHREMNTFNSEIEQYWLPTAEELVRFPYSFRPTPSFNGKLILELK
jgi:hypothetical protein